MAGGVDIHAHIAGPKVNAARKLSPDDRPGDPLEPNDGFALGHRRIGPVDVRHRLPLFLAGYTTVVEAAAPPLAARHASELRDTPLIDKAFLILMGNNQVLFELIRQDGGPVSPQLRDAVAWWLEATGGYGVKLVNPGGVELWSRTTATSTRSTSTVAGFDVTLREVLEAIGGAVDELELAAPGPRPCQQPRCGRATPTRHWTRCARCQVARRISPTSSSTATAASPGPAPRPVRPS